jgi:hypothetical protein
MKKYDDETNFDEALNFFYFATRDRLNIITPELAEIFKLLEEHDIEYLINRSNVVMSNFFIVCKALYK